jgi:hypothetical protein
MSDLRTLYRQHRTQGMNASSALAYARTIINRENVDFPCPSYPGDDCETFERDGFTIQIRVKHDETADFSHLGELSDRWERGAIAWKGDRHEYKYFIPTNSEEDQYRGLLDMKYGRAQARDAARECVKADYEQMKAFCGDRSAMYGVIVTASREGVELGKDSLWGVDDTYIVGAILDHDMIGNAIREAREKLRELCVTV